MKRYQWQAKGRVQGVGFRYTSQKKASALHLTGWVKNEVDGTVSLEVQGESENIKQLKDFLRAGNGHIRVDELTEKEIAVIPGENDFRIIY